MASETLLITGGAGFIGANLSRHLLKMGRKVRVLDDFSTGRWEYLGELAPDVEVHEGDVRDLRALKRAAHGTRGIFHLAAVTSALPEQDETRMLDVNVKGAVCALIAARELRLPLVFASSSAVYGTRDAYLLHEKMPPDPNTPLGTQKLAAEQYCHLFFESHSTRTVVLRIFHAFGPFQDGSSPSADVVARFAHTLVHGQTPIIFGDGSQTRDFLYVSNVCDAFVQALRSVDAAGGVFNIGSGDAIAINLLYNSMAEIAGCRRAPLRAPARPSALRHVRAAMGHATTVLRYAPTVRLRQGLERTIAWHKSRVATEQSRAWFTAESDEPAAEREGESGEAEIIPLFEAEEIGA